MTFLRPSSSPIIPQASMIEAKAEGVAADHPLQIGDRGVQVGLSDYGSVVGRYATTSGRESAAGSPEYRLTDKI